MYGISMELWNIYGIKKKINVWDIYGTMEYLWDKKKINVWDIYGTMEYVQYIYGIFMVIIHMGVSENVVYP